MNSNQTNALQIADLTSMAERKRNVLQRESRVYEKLLDKLELAIDRLLDDDAGANLSPADIGRLLDFACKLGRLNAGMATDHVEHEHAWSQYHDPVFIGQINRELDKVFGKPIEVKTEPGPAEGENNYDSVTPNVRRGHFSRATSANPTTSSADAVHDRSNSQAATATAPASETHDIQLDLAQCDPRQS